VSLSDALETSCLGAMDFRIWGPLDLRWVASRARVHLVLTSRVRALVSCLMIGHACIPSRGRRTVRFVYSCHVCPSVAVWAPSSPELPGAGAPLRRPRLRGGLPRAVLAYAGAPCAVLAYAESSWTPGSSSSISAGVWISDVVSYRLQVRGARMRGLCCCSRRRTLSSSRWRSLIRHLLRIRRLQRIFAHSGRHLQEAYPDSLRRRLRQTFPTGRQAQLLG
jgi:hypothetical protein